MNGRILRQERGVVFDVCLIRLMLLSQFEKDKSRERTEYYVTVMN